MLKGGSIVKMLWTKWHDTIEELELDVELYKPFVTVKLQKFGSPQFYENSFMSLCPLPFHKWNSPLKEM